MKSFMANKTAFLGAAVRLMMLALLWMASRNAWASISCSTPPQTYAIQFPSRISVPSDAPVGTLLTPWVATAGLLEWQCRSTSHLWYGPAAITAAYSQASGITTTYDGKTITVYNTNVAGVGIAIAHNDMEDHLAGWSGWLSLTNDWHGAWSTSSIRPQLIQGGVQVMSALVKTANVVAPGQIPVGTTVAKTALLVDSSDFKGPVPETMNYHNIGAPIDILPFSCTVPDVAVNLGEVATAGFKGVGSSTRGKPFNLNLNNCPAGMHSVSLQVHPTNGIFAGTRDVAMLNANSGAQGVGVKMQWANGDPLTLDAKTRVTDYQGQAISLSLGLNAAYYQTNPIIQPGSANASFEVTLFYE